MADTEAARLKRRRTDSAASPSGRPAKLPKPTKFLKRCEAEPALVSSAPAGSYMELDAYLRLKEHPKHCNLQLKAAAASASELAAFPARLPSADAVRLSPVLDVRLEHWEQPADSRGVTVLELQLRVPQQLLDAVVRAVYARQLLVGPETAEGLLLLADYLQLEWLTLAVEGYLTDHVLDASPAAVLQLCDRYPELAGDELATRRVLERLQPRELATLLQLTPQRERLAVFETIANRAGPVQLLELLCHLEDARDARLEPAELHLVAARHPELPAALHMRPAGRVNLAALWEEHWELHQKAVRTGSRDLARQPAGAALVWHVPLKQLRESGRCCSAGVLELQDGRRFGLEAVRAQSQEPGGGWELGLFVHARDGTGWRQDDVFTLSAVRRAEPSRRAVETGALAGGAISSWGFRDLITVWLNKYSCTIRRGALLPVMLAYSQLGA